MAESLGKKAIKGTLWSACERFGVMGLQFCVNLILARLLTPADFGTIGLLSIFIAVSQTFIDGGFGSALIQKKHPSEIDYSTIFFWNIFVSCICYLALFFTSPLISKFYNIPVLSPILKVLGISLLLNSANAIQVNRLQKQLKFSLLAQTSILTYFLSAILTIFLAYRGYGVWSLVAMSVVQPLIRIVILFFLTRWHPILIFSIESFKKLVSFGGYLLLGNLLESIFKNIQGLIIGKKFSAAQMGYYSQADKLDQIVSYSIPQVISSVMYPVFSQFQDDKVRLQELIKYDFRVISFGIYPLLTCMILIAYHLIMFLYGEKWLESAPYFQILCFGGFLYSINNISYYAVAASGKSKALLGVAIYKWLMLGVFIFIGMNFGMKGIMWGIALSYWNIFFTNTVLAKKYVGIKIREVVKSLYPALIVSVISAIPSWLILNAIPKYWYITIISYIIIYMVFSFLINKPGCEDAKLIISKILKK